MNIPNYLIKLYSLKHCRCNRGRYFVTTIASVNKSERLIRDHDADDVEWLDNDLKSNKPLLVLNLAKSVAHRNVFVQNYCQIGSYNWLLRSKKYGPTVVVPGAPKKYVPYNTANVRGDGNMLKLDTNFERRKIIDENHYRMPVYPMDPLFRAVDLCAKLDGKRANFQNYDIVTDRNNLRKLFSYCCLKEENVLSALSYQSLLKNDDTISTGSESKKQKSFLRTEFRIDVQRLGNLVAFVRQEKSDVANMRRVSYGLDFEKICAKPVNPTASGSFRQISEYSFGGLKMLVRFEVNCADYETTRDESDLITDMVSDNKVEDSDSNLNIVRWGKRRRYHLVELATRSKTVNWDNIKLAIWPQLYFASVDSLVLAVHDNGLCYPGNIQRHRWSNKVQEFEIANKGRLQQLCNLLHNVVDFVRNTSDSRTYALIYNSAKSKNLELYEVDNSKRFAVSNDVKKLITNSSIKD